MKKILMSLMVLGAFNLHAANFECGGTEPFWNLSVKSDKMIYENFEEDKKVLTIKSVQQAVNMSEDAVVVVKSLHTSLTMLKGKCSDGMSDLKYAYHAIYDVQGSIFYGCCNKKK